MFDFADPAPSKIAPMGEIYWIIKNSHDDMPAKGPRITTGQGSDLVNYVRSFAKKRKATQSRNPRPSRYEQYFEVSKTLRLATPDRYASRA